jgi:carbamoyltransferase
LQFSGGGAMNIINNSIYDAFVSPNPDDRGIALGLVLSKIKTGNIIDSTYLGSEPYDSLPDYFDLNIEEIVTDLINGKIIGIIQGNSEHGARSLGNRSIICMPSAGMKEKLNSEVKHREMFRPFAPVVRLEDASEFFEFGNHTRWMTHNSIVKEKYKSKIPAITHIDGTARLQTVTKHQNELIYTLLSKLENRGHIPVLLNTSFNIQGNPILNRYADAILIRDTTGLDKVITDKFLLK